jgi:hypothetical protein
MRFYWAFPQESGNLRCLVCDAPTMLLQDSHELTVWEGPIMQKGSLVRRARHSQSEVWEFRWREPGPASTRRHRRIVVGSTDQIADESAARKAVAALQIEINQNMKSTQPAITIGDLVQHFQQRELRTESPGAPSLHETAVKATCGNGSCHAGMNTRPKRLRPERSSFGCDLYLLRGRAAPSFET